MRIQERKRYKEIFVDEASIWSLLYLAFAFRSCDRFWYFGEIDFRLKKLWSILRKILFVRIELNPIQYKVTDREIVHALEINHRIWLRVRDLEIIPNNVVRRMSLVWPEEKIFLYFHKLMEADIRLSCMQVCLFKRIMDDPEVKTPLLLMARNRWSSYLQAQGDIEGVRVCFYNRIIPMSKMLRIPKWFVSRRIHCRKLLRWMMRIIPAFLERKSKMDAHIFNPGIGGFKIGIHYCYQRLTFNPSERSEFFWLIESDIPKSEILLHSYVNESPLDEQSRIEVATESVGVLGSSPNVPIWVPTKKMPLIFANLGAIWLSAVVNEILKGRINRLYYAANLLHLALNYSYWYDFFKTNNILVNVASINTKVEETLAIECLGGVSVGYQISASILPFTTFAVAGENVIFVFSPVFEKLFGYLEPMPDTFVTTGYVYDGIIEHIKESGQPQKMRQDILDNGAEFIICFFDDTAMNGWFRPYSEADLIEDYKFLLEWALIEPRLGLVFKPKRPNLFDRLSPISDLIDQMVLSGRCKFLTVEYNDSIVSNVYPAEAAMISDVCIGPLWGPTAVLEGYLAGTPGILLDAEELEDRPFYPWGRDGVIFKNWNEVKSKIEQYWDAPQDYPEFGDWLPGIANFDVYRDGKASLRMGQYIANIYSLLKQGKSKDESLEIAKQWYDDKWACNAEHYRRD